MQQVAERVFATRTIVFDGFILKSTESNKIKKPTFNSEINKIIGCFLLTLLTGSNESFRVFSVISPPALLTKIISPLADA